MGHPTQARLIWLTPGWITLTCCYEKPDRFCVILVGCERARICGWPGLDRRVMTPMELDILDGDGRSPEDATEAGSYFVSNYPPYSAWSGDQVEAAHRALSTPPSETDHRPLGLYLHIPFCRKRCKFCYFRVYTDKNSSDVDVYLRALAKETELYAAQAGLQGRDFEFVYFGGGTPSFLSSEQLKRMVDRINDHWNWEAAREVTFECEPGTLKKQKLETIRSLGVTRLSLGIEHFNDDVLERGGRAHKSAESLLAYAWAKEVGFPQINVDLIAGMIGDTEVSWKDTVEKTLALDPDNVTIYQMEAPHNSRMAKEAREAGTVIPVASWSQKRAWVDYAFTLFEQSGYVVSSAYTLVKPQSHEGFVYRDALWRGADMIGAGVASFSHFGGVHFQNDGGWDGYTSALLARGTLPLYRALPTNEHQRLIREMVLQLKLGRIDAGYFREKFDVEILEAFAQAFCSLVDDGFATIEGDAITLNRAGLLCVDELLWRFFEPQYRNAGSG